jgi:hypothetical protein
MAATLDEQLEGAEASPLDVAIGREAATGDPRFRKG